MIFINIYYSICVFIITQFAKSLAIYAIPLPLVITTKSLPISAQNAWNTLSNTGCVLDAIESACNTCETQECGNFPTWGRLPDENGETILDALIMDGTTLNVGAVGSLRRVKKAISVARKVLENTAHTLIVGDLATKFAVQMGFQEENLTSDWSANIWNMWRSYNCQPNFWLNVEPNFLDSCGPYLLLNPKTNTYYVQKSVRISKINGTNPQTLSIIAIDSNRNVSAGVTSTGLTFKIIGRVGGSAIAGTGAYADSKFGGAVCTGSGDITMRLAPSYQAVENLRDGMNPKEAAEDAIEKIYEKYPTITTAIIVADIKGNYGAACINYSAGFKYTVRNSALGRATEIQIACKYL